jgi:antitoxin MazE
MKSRLIRIGNSRGVRLPKAIIDQVGLADEVDLRVGDHCIVIAPGRPPRAGWADAARRLGAESRGLLDPQTRTHFDEDEWDW